MITFLFDTINRYKKFSENLDVKTILCNKSWWIFNDSGEKIIIIFQENSSLIISSNGKVTSGKWQYIPANKSVIISFGKQSYMHHSAFIDNNILVLQVDGTELYTFMIDEEYHGSFRPRSLKDLYSYFERMEYKKTEEENNRKKILLEQQRQREELCKAEEARKIREKQETQYAQQLEEARRKEIEEKREKQNKILKQNKEYQIFKIICFFIIIAMPNLLFWTLNTDFEKHITFAIFLPLICYIVWIIIIHLPICKHAFLKIDKKNQEKIQLIKEKGEMLKRELERESAILENKLNSAQDIIDYKNRIKLSVKNLEKPPQKIFEVGNRESFNICWDTPYMRFDNISLIINNGNDVILHENLKNSGKLLIQLKNIKSRVRITLRIIWLNIPVYKIILIDKK